MSSPTAVSQITVPKRIRSASTEQTQTPAISFLVLIAAAAALPFLPALRYGFVYDDEVQIVETVAARAWQSPWSYFIRSVWALQGSLVGRTYYRPLFQTWLRFNGVLFGQDAFWWHLSAIIPHVIVALLVFFLIRHYIANPWCATLGTLVFAVHPVHIESVAWISGADDPLMSIGLLGSFLLWLKKEETGDRRLLFASLGCYAGALLLKETAVVLPVIVFAHVLLGIGGRRDALTNFRARMKAAVLQSLPFVVMAGLFWSVRTAVVHHALQAQAKPWVTPWQALLTAPSVLVFYLQHLIWPVGLRLFYEFGPVSRPADARFWEPLVALSMIALLMIAWARRRSDQAIAAAAIWLLVPLAPLLNIGFLYQDDFLHDRYLYLPTIGLAILCSAAAQILLGRMQSERWRLVGVAIVTLLLASLAGLAAVESAPWQNDLALYSHAADHSTNAAARINLAFEYANRGRLQDAKQLLDMVIEQRPDSWLANYDLGYVDYRLKDLDAAAPLLDRSIALNPNDADAYLYRGMVFFRTNQRTEALLLVRHAIAINPAGEGYHFALGALLESESRDAAKSEFLEELKYHPNSGLAKMAVQSLDAQKPLR